MKHILYKTLCYSLLLSASICTRIAATDQQPSTEQTIANYQQALAHNINDGQTHFALANEYFWHKNYPLAQHHYQETIRLFPQSTQAQYNCAIAYMHTNEYLKAEDHFEKALALDPNHVKTLMQFGTMLGKQGQYERAYMHLTKAVTIDPRCFAYMTLGHLHNEQGRCQEAIIYFTKALELQPDDHQALLDLANSYNMNRQAEKALELYYHLNTLIPNNTNVLHNIAYTLKKLNRIDEALSYYDQVIALDPTNAEARFSRSLAYLVQGDFARGWQEYEWRWKRTSKMTPRSFAQPLWDGSDIFGKTILIHAEQGFGDGLQFIRYGKLLKEQGATVVVAAHQPLIQLLSLCPYIDTVVGLSDPLPQFDTHISLLSLPRVLQTELETIPAEIPYLYSDEQLTRQWHDTLTQEKTFNIGICWHGNPHYSTLFLKKAVAEKSIPLNTFKPLATLPNVRLYSLQKVSGTDEIATKDSDFILHEFTGDFDQSHGRFMDTAAVIKSLDLIITIDTSIAHLAGGLGAPVWVLLPQPADWRWLLDRTDSPWYPTMRLFRQEQPGDWESVLNTVRNELAHLLSTKKSTATAEIAIGELIDKMTILEIKLERISDEAKLKNIKTEYASLYQTYKEIVEPSADLDQLTHELLETNKKLWDIEDALRDKERAKTFDNEFIELARSVYHTNDHRCAVKRTINDYLGSHLIEEKSYAAY